MQGAAKLTTPEEAEHHREVTEAVHAEDGRICLQILHAGRYAYSPDQVAPSAIQAPINPFTPRALKHLVKVPLLGVQRDCKCCHASAPAVNWR